MKEELKILVIEDSADDYDLLLREIRKGGYSVVSERVETEEGLKQSLTLEWDLVISDNSLPKLNAPTALKLTRAVNENVPFLIVSGTIGEEAAVEAMRAGANDYILKGNLPRLMPAIERELKEAKNRVERLTAERKLDKSQKMYKFLSGSINDAFIALDHDLKILSLNFAASESLHIKNENLVGWDIYALFPEWEGTVIEETMNYVLKNMKSEPISFDYGPDFFEGRIYPSEEGLTMIVRNITEKKAAEESLQKINTELETLMYRISHDLKGPVATISGLINVGNLDFKDEHFRTFLTMLDKNTIKLKKTLDELLNISRIKQGQIMAEPVMLKEIINDIKEALKYNDGFDEVKINLDLIVDERVVSDKRLLTSIFQNLLENAIKYRKQSRNFDSWIYISAKRKGDSLSVQVVDNGEGISKSLQDNVFEMFFRAHEFSSGSGLGLYIVRNALDKIKGTISLKSGKGEGCSFDLLIPDWGN